MGMGWRCALGLITCHAVLLHVAHYLQLKLRPGDIDGVAICMWAVFPNTFASVSAHGVVFLFVSEFWPPWSHFGRFAAVLKIFVLVLCWGVLVITWWHGGVGQKLS